MKGLGGGFFVCLFLLWLAVSPSQGVERGECLECHGSRDILEMSPEERLEMVVPVGKGVRREAEGLFVDPERFEASAHGEMGCVDCHADIEELPHRQRLSRVDCGMCHEEVVAQYRESEHAKVGETLCYECHNPHYSKPFREMSLEERLGLCLRCHEGVQHQWLPQEELHLKYLECTTCHAPRAKKAIAYYPVAEYKGEKRRVSLQELKALLGSDVEEVLDPDGNGLIELKELEGFLQKLKEGGLKSPGLKEEILVIEPYHDFTDEVKYIKDCTFCHTSAAPFYERVLLRLPMDGEVCSFELDREVLAKIPSVPTKDLYSETVHGKSGVECVDCHEDLQVLRAEEGFRVKELGEPVCEKCHEEVMGEYRRSVHFRVSGKMCQGCHDPHSAVPFYRLSRKERMAICLKCHPRMEEAHDWLPQASLHFDHLECTICHAPESEVGVVMKIRGVDKEGRRKALTYRELVELVGQQDLIKAVDPDGDGRVEVGELIPFLMRLREGGDRRWKRLSLGVEVLVLRTSHNFTGKSKKARECEACHSSVAPFYKTVVLQVPLKGGDLRTLELEREVLVATQAIPITSDFYLLGEMRLSREDLAELWYVVKKIGYKWLDVVGVVFLLGAIGFVGLHGFLRVFTRRRRGHREE